MVQRTKEELLADMEDRLPTNDRGLITAAVMRNQLTDIIDSVVFPDDLPDEEEPEPGTGSQGRYTVLRLLESTALTTADHLNRILVFDTLGDVSFTLPNNAQAGDWVIVRRGNLGHVAWALAAGAFLENPASKVGHTRLGEQFSQVHVYCLRNDGGTGAVWTIDGPTQSDAPPVEDTDPAAFAFTDVTNAELSTVYISNPITVQDIGSAADIVVSGDASAAYSINGGSFVSTDGTVVEGDSVRVRVTSSDSNSTGVSATLTIGTVSDTYTVTSKAAVASDTTPDAFSFATKTNQALSSDVISDVITVSGIDAGTDISITGGAYSRNGGAFTSSPGTGTIFNGDVIRVRVTTSSSNSTTTTATLNIGGVTGTFSATTLAAVDTTPDAFSWSSLTDVQPATVYESGTITISGITDPASITITNGSYKKNSGSYTSSAGTVANGDTIRLRTTSDNSAGVTKTVTVVIGGVTGTWQVTTAEESGGGSGDPGTVNIQEGMWKITMPYDSAGKTYADTSSPGTAVEVWPPTLNSLDNQYFDRQTDGSIIFKAPTNGATTSGSSYARCELREILPDASNEYEWTVATGGKLEATCAVLEMPTLTNGSNNRVVIGQIHGPDDELCRLMYWSTGKLSFYDDKAIDGSGTSETEFVLLSSGGTPANIPLEAWFDYKIEADASGCKVTVVYDEVTYTAFSPLSSFWPGKDLYYKAGAYLQVGRSTGSSTNRGTGQARVHFRRILAPVHPYSYDP